VLLEYVSTEVGETCAVTWLGTSTEAEVVTVNGVGHEAGAVIMTGMLKAILVIVAVVVEGVVEVAS
jgi:hypothetical protein